MRLGMGLGLGNLLSGGPITGMSNKFSFNFDGSNDYLEIADTDGLDVGTNDFTFSAWVYLSDASENYILSKGDADNHYGFRINGNRRISYEFEVSTTNKSATDDGTQLTLGQWHHVAVVFDRDGSTYRYLDGVNTGTNDVLSGNTGSLSTTDNLNVGRKYSGHHYFDGLIDEVGIWAYALAATDIAKIASKPSDLSKASSYVADRSSTLKLWLRAGDKVLPEEDASIARSDFYTDFDGTNDHVVVSDNSALDFGTGDFTVALWHKSGAEHDQPFINKKTAFADNTAGWTIYMENGNDQMRCRIAGGSSNVAVSAGTKSVSDNNWHFTTMVRSGDNLYLYTDGVLEGSTTGVNSLDVDNSDDLYIGRGGSAYPQISASSASIYQTALDAQTIKQFAKSRFTPMRDNRFSVVDFDGTNDSIVTSGNVGISGSSARTLGLWFKPTATDQYYELIEWGGTGSANATCGLYLYNSKIFFLWLGSR